jgi:hypothetical protein
MLKGRRLMMVKLDSTAAWRSKNSANYTARSSVNPRPADQRCHSRHSSRATGKLPATSFLSIGEGAWEDDTGRWRSEGWAQIVCSACVLRRNKPEVILNRREARPDQTTVQLVRQLLAVICKGAVQTCSSAGGVVRVRIEAEHVERRWAGRVADWWESAWSSGAVVRKLLLDEPGKDAVRDIGDSNHIGLRRSSEMAVDQLGWRARRERWRRRYLC